jgi:hypothetical protein
MAGAPLWLIILTAATYAAFAIGFGIEVFDAPSGSCSGVIDCATGIFAIIGDAFDFITLGGNSGLLPALVQVPLLIVLAAGWGFVLGDVLLP